MSEHWVIQSRQRGACHAFRDWQTAVVATSKEVAERFAAIWNLFSKAGWEYRAKGAGDDERDEREAVAARQ
jgi:hypothetical protein